MKHPIDFWQEISALCATEDLDSIRHALQQQFIEFGILVLRAEEEAQVSRDADKHRKYLGEATRAVYEVHSAWKALKAVVEEAQKDFTPPNG